MRTDFHKLMHATHPSDNRPVLNLHMTSKLCITRQNGVITHAAIMRQMNIAHDPVVITNAGDAFVLRRAQMKTTKLTNRIAITNHQTRRFPCIFFILRHAAQQNVMADVIAHTNRSVPFNHRMRTDFRPVANHDVWTDDTVRANADAFAQLGFRINDCCCMNVCRHKNFY